MADELSEDRQQLIFRYMEGAVRSEPAELPRRRPAFDGLEKVEAHPRAQLDLRRWAATLIHRHPQLRSALVLVVIAVTVGWLVARF